jgi:hypothetical protein
VCPEKADETVIVENTKVLKQFKETYEANTNCNERRYESKPCPVLLYSKSLAMEAARYGSCLVLIRDFNRQATFIISQSELQHRQLIRNKPAVSGRATLTIFVSFGNHRKQAKLRPMLNRGRQPKVDSAKHCKPARCLIVNSQ